MYVLCYLEQLANVSVKKREMNKNTKEVCLLMNT